MCLGLQCLGLVGGFSASCLGVVASGHAILSFGHCIHLCGFVLTALLLICGGPKS